MAKTNPYDAKYARRVSPDVARSFSKKGFLPPIGRGIFVVLGPLIARWSESPRPRLMLANISGDFYLLSRNTEVSNWLKEFGVEFDANGDVLKLCATREKQGELAECMPSVEPHVSP